MLILGIDPGPEVHGVVVYDTEARRVTFASKAATSAEVIDLLGQYKLGLALIERPAAMGALGPGIVGHMLDTAWAAARLECEIELRSYAPCVTMTRRQVLRSLGVLSGKGSSDSKVRAACIADHETPGGPPAVGRKAAPGPLYGVSSHAWQALGLVLAWLEHHEKEWKNA